MEKNRLEIAQRLGIKVKTNSKTPGIYVKNGGERKKINIEEIFPEIKDLNHSISIQYTDVAIYQAGKELTNVAPENKSFTETDMLIGAS